MSAPVMMMGSVLALALSVGDLLARALVALVGFIQ